MTKTADFFCTFTVPDHALTLAVATYMQENDLADMPHPIMDGDGFAEVIQAVLFDRAQTFGQTGLDTWCEDISGSMFLQAQAFCIGACIEGDPIADYL